MSHPERGLDHVDGGVHAPERCHGDGDGRVPVAAGVAQRGSELQRPRVPARPRHVNVQPSSPANVAARACGPACVRELHEHGEDGPADEERPTPAELAAAAVREGTCTRFREWIWNQPRRGLLRPHPQLAAPTAPSPGPRSTSAPPRCAKVQGTPCMRHLSRIRPTKRTASCGCGHASHVSQTAPTGSP